MSAPPCASSTTAISEVVGLTAVSVGSGPGAIVTRVSPVSTGDAEYQARSETGASTGPSVSTGPMSAAAETRTPPTIGWSADIVTVYSPSASATPVSTSVPASSGTSVTMPGSAWTGKLVPSIDGSSGVTLTVTSVVVVPGFRMRTIGATSLQSSSERARFVPTESKMRTPGR